MFVYLDVSLYREHRQGGRAGDRGSFNGPLLPTGEREVLDHRPANGVHGISKPSSGMRFSLLNVVSLRCCNII